MSILSFYVFSIADFLFRIEDDEFNIADVTFMINVCLFIVMDVCVGLFGSDVRWI